VHSDGFNEDVESSKDYIALHVYNNANNKNRKVTQQRGCIKRSVYSPAQTIMLYLNLPCDEHLNQANVMNLVLDQLDRTRDLYFNIRIFSQAPFSVTRPKQ